MALFLMIAILGSPAYCQESGSIAPDEDVLRIEGGLVSAITEIDVPARVKGFVEEMNFEEGDFVEIDTVIAQLDTTSINNELISAELRRDNSQRQADDETPIDYARASYDLAKQEFETSQGLLESRAIPRQEYDRLRLAMIQADLQTKRSLAQKEIDAGTVALEEQNVKSVNDIFDRHSIKAAFSGQILKIHRHAGEFVQEGQTVFQLIDLSRIIVEGRVDSEKYNAFELEGKPVTITLKMARGKTESFTGTIARISVKYQFGREGSIFVIQAEFDNRKKEGQWLLKPDGKVTMEIDLR